MDRTNTKLLLDPDGVKVDEGERDLNSFPLTPGRASKYYKATQQSHEALDMTTRKD